MPKPHIDLAMKEFFLDKTLFADLFSKAYFKGLVSIDPDHLIPFDKESFVNGDHRMGDLIMIYKDQVLFHLEIQSRKDRFMPLRMKNYCFLETLQQTLSGSSSQKLMSVCCLTLYVGEGAWTTHRRLSDCVDLDKGLSKEIRDYEMSLYDINTDPVCFEQVNLQKFFKTIQYAYQGRWNDLMNDPLLETLDEHLIRFISVLINIDHEFLMKHKKKGTINMCEAMRLWNLENQNIGLQKGITIGIEEGKALGIEEGKALGIKEGKALGMDEGEMSAQRKIVLRMYHIKDMNVDEISDLTGYDISYIQSILQDKV